MSTEILTFHYMSVGRMLSISHVQFFLTCWYYFENLGDW